MSVTTNDGRKEENTNCVGDCVQTMRRSKNSFDNDNVYDEGIKTNSTCELSKNSPKNNNCEQWIWWKMAEKKISAMITKELVVEPTRKRALANEIKCASAFALFSESHTVRNFGFRLEV